MLKEVARLTLSSPEQTSAMAERIGACLTRGDCLLLEGPIGAGKTHFSRSLIKSLTTQAEDVPSPTFTLVQTYDAHGIEVWHADLYRLTTPDDVIELGLVDAFETAICLVEWPDRLGALRPRNALTLRFELGATEDERLLSLMSESATWQKRLTGVFHDGP